MILREAIPDEPCITTYSGRQLLLRAPDAAQIDIHDIARGLAYQSCLNGQTQAYYSLAQRSLLVARLLPVQHRLAGLLHDAVAAYLGDQLTLLRQLIPGFDEIEQGILAAVGKKFAVSGLDNPAIERAHLVARATEERDMHGTPTSARRTGSSAPVPRRIECQGPDDAMAEFLAMFDQLHKPARPALHATGQWLPAARSHLVRVPPPARFGSGTPGRVWP